MTRRAPVKKTTTPAKKGRFTDEERAFLSGLLEDAGDDAGDPEQDDDQADDGEPDDEDTTGAGEVGDDVVILRGKRADRFLSLFGIADGDDPDTEDEPGDGDDTTPEDPEPKTGHRYFR